MDNAKRPNVYPDPLPVPGVIQARPSMHARYWSPVTVRRIRSAIWFASSSVIS